jgi:hypothetical protein
MIFYHFFIILYYINIIKLYHFIYIQSRYSQAVTHLEAVETLAIATSSSSILYPAFCRLWQTLIQNCSHRTYPTLRSTLRYIIFLHNFLHVCFLSLICFYLLDSIFTIFFSFLSLLYDVTAIPSFFIYFVLFCSIS